MVTASNASVSRRSFVALAGATLASLALPASAQGERLKMMIGMVGGSANDMANRALARAMQDDRPGLVIDVENASGSSGKLVFRALLQAAGNPAFLGFVQNGLLYALLADDAQLDEFRSLTLIGGLGRDDRSLFIATSSGITSFEQLQAREEPIVMAAINATSTGTIDTLVINALTGTRIRPVPGFASNAERKLAILNGEASIIVGSTQALADFVEAGLIRPLLRLNTPAEGALFPETPLLRDVARGPDAAALTQLVDTMTQTQQFVLAPPGLDDAAATHLTGLARAAAEKLAAQQAIGYQPDDAIFADRQAVTTRLADLFANPDLHAALRRAIDCGTTLGEGGQCS